MKIQMYIHGTLNGRWESLRNVMNMAGTDWVVARGLIHYYQFLGGLMAGSADPQILKVPTQIYSIYSSLEEFMMPEKKRIIGNLTLKWQGNISRLLIMRFDERAMVSRPDL